MIEHAAWEGDRLMGQSRLPRCDKRANLDRNMNLAGFLRRQAAPACLAAFFALGAISVLLLSRSTDPTDSSKSLPVVPLHIDKYGQGASKRQFTIDTNPPPNVKS